MDLAFTPGEEAFRNEVRAFLSDRLPPVRQEISALARRALGPYARPFLSDLLGSDSDGSLGEAIYAPGVTPAYLNLRKLTIFGGSNEIQRNIITKTSLRL